MAISKPIIDSGPTTTRGRQKTVVFPLSTALPPSIRIFTVVDEDGNEDLTFEEQDPDIEGKMAITVFQESWPQIIISVVVNIEGTLQWKRVAPRMTYIDNRTGKPWDPFFGRVSGMPR